MIDLEKIRVEDLPFVSFDDFRHLPVLPGVYFVTDDEGKILYIGQTANLNKRFAGKHHRLAALIEHSARRIHWLACDKSIALETENAAISHFSPLLNIRIGRKKGSYIRFNLVMDEELFRKVVIMAQQNNQTITGQIIACLERSTRRIKVENEPTSTL